MSYGTIDRIGHHAVSDATVSNQAERAQAYQRSELHADRVALTQAAHIGALQATREKVDAATLNQMPFSSIVRHPDKSVTWLQDQHANDRLDMAIHAFIAEQAKLQARGDAANDLGTIPGMLLLQPYRFAAGVPPIQPAQLAVAASVVPNNVNPVSNVAVTRRATDDAFSATVDKRGFVRRLQYLDA